MKDILAALGAKRRTARVGGRDECSAVRHAKGKLIALLAASAGAAFMGLAWAQEEPGCGVASAQEACRWRDPTGAWSINFVTSDWLYGEGLPPGDLVLAIAPRDRSEGARMCFVDQTFTPLPSGETDAEVRARASQFDAAQARAAFQRYPPTRIEVTHATAGGQSVAIVTGRWRSFRFRGRAFTTPVVDRIALSAISCLSSRSARPEHDAEIDAILSSLRFEPPGSLP